MLLWLLQTVNITETMIHKPYHLADIPHDLTGLPENVFAADVLAVTGYRKRKRSELALAIDRQGINIYDVRLQWVFHDYQPS